MSFGKAFCIAKLQLGVFLPMLELSERESFALNSSPS